MAKVKKGLRKKQDEIVGLEYDGTNAQDVVTFSEAEVGKTNKVKLQSGYLIEDDVLKFYYAPTNTAYVVEVGDWALMNRATKTPDRLDGDTVSKKWEDTGVVPTAK